MNSTKYIICILCVYLVSCATKQSQQTTGDFKLIIEKPAKYIIGSPQQLITGHIYNAKYKNINIPDNSKIMGLYENNGNACKVTWNRIISPNGESIAKPNIASSQCDVHAILVVNYQLPTYWSNN